MRALVLIAFLAAVAALLWTGPRPRPEAESPSLTYVTTAKQLGVVGYRDPAGAISPDGTRLAYTEGRFVHVLPIGGGVAQTLPGGDGQIRAIAWIGNERLLAEEAGTGTRWWTFTLTATGADRAPWLGGGSISAERAISAGDLRQAAVSADGRSIAALVAGKDGAELWRFAADGSSAQRQQIAGRPSFPAWTAAGEVGCVIASQGRSRLSIPCGSAARALDSDHEVIGPIAFSPQGEAVYYASPNQHGMVELWRADLASGRNRRITSFTRDAYAPSIAGDGTVVFKVQSYRTHLADAPSSGGPARQLTTFQSETPTYHPAAPRLAFTYGTWRRVVDDAKYPDIAQEIGVIDLSQKIPADKPSEIIAQSDSEDQAMAWSPNGKWIAFHTHREMSDDVWLRPSDGSAPDRQITFLGRGAEVGWPRWSADGKMVLLDGARKSDGRSVVYVIGVDQDSGRVTSELREVRADGFEGELTHAEWLPDGRQVIAIGREGPGRHAIVRLPITGGTPQVIHRFATEHDFPGLGVSADGASIAFTAPAPDGFFQIFRIPAAGGVTPVQVTTDPSHKTQPTWSTDGARIAFTVWSYEATFWSMR